MSRIILGRLNFSCMPDNQHADKLKRFFKHWSTEAKKEARTRVRTSLRSKRFQASEILRKSCFLLSSLQLSRRTREETLATQAR